MRSKQNKARRQSDLAVLSPLIATGVILTLNGGNLFEVQQNQDASSPVCRIVLQGSACQEWIASITERNGFAGHTMWLYPT